jgi:hypothetical protein
MPALNTPQFGWVKSRLKHKAQPVPPIYEPEVGARAVFWAAHHDRREVYVGGSTVEAIVGNKVAPGILDQYLGRTGVNSQQTSELENPSRPDNLWTAVDARQDHGAHGSFDDRAHHFSYQLWADLNRPSLALGCGVAAGVLASLFLGRNGRSRNGHQEKTARNEL